ncbi:MAG: iron-containing redox enzyme family protein [Chloroflexota bacterium]
MQLKSETKLDIEPWNLLNHPFYKAWNAGTLPLKALKTYAEEYGVFIDLMPIGWQTLDDEETATEEREHIELWAEFADGLNTAVSVVTIDEVMSLRDVTERLFASSATAVGAMYAFEMQQPETARTKLSGLQEFYELPSSCEVYFETHSHNEHEAEKLLAYYNRLSFDEQSIADLACSEMSKAMWDALTGIHDWDCDN